MTTRSKRKGNGFEVELVKALKGKGIHAERAWGSNGVALGEAPDVDVTAKIGDAKWKFQAKRRAKLPKYLIPSGTVDAVVTREDRGVTLIVMRFDEFLTLIGG